jgi:hypothetical protein
MSTKKSHCRFLTRKRRSRKKDPTYYYLEWSESERKVPKKYTPSCSCFVLYTTAIFHIRDGPTTTRAPIWRNELLPNILRTIASSSNPIFTHVKIIHYDCEIEKKLSKQQEEQEELRKGDQECLRKYHFNSEWSFHPYEFPKNLEIPKYHLLMDMANLVEHGIRADSKSTYKSTYAGYSKTYLCNLNALYLPYDWIFRSVSTDPLLTRTPFLSDVKLFELGPEGVETVCDKIRKCKRLTILNLPYVWYGGFEYLGRGVVPWFPEGSSVTGEDIFNNIWENDCCTERDCTNREHAHVYQKQK